MIIPWLIQKFLNPEYCYGVQGQSGKTESVMVSTILSGVEGPVHPDLDQKKWWTIYFSVKDPFCCDFADEHKHTVRGGATWVEHWCVRWWVSTCSNPLQMNLGFTQHVNTLLNILQPFSIWKFLTCQPTAPLITFCRPMKISGLKQIVFNLGPKLINIYIENKLAKEKKVVEIALVLSCLEKQLYETLKNVEPSSVDDVLEGFKTSSLTSEGRTLHVG